MQKIKDFLMGSRMKSLYWRTSMMFLSAFISNLSLEMNGWGLTPQAVVFLGLLLGEFSKAINNALSGK